MEEEILTLTVLWSILAAYQAVPAITLTVGPVAYVLRKFREQEVHPGESWTRIRPFSFMVEGMMEPTIVGITSAALLVKVGTVDPTSMFIAVLISALNPQRWSRYIAARLRRMLQTPVSAPVNPNLHPPEKKEDVTSDPD